MFMASANEAVNQDDFIVNGKFRVITAEEEAEMERQLIENAGRMQNNGKRGRLILQQIPAAYTGTGLPEWIEYQVPNGYKPSGPALPMMVCWHSYGQSCQSVAYDSQIDEECNARKWFYLAITGAQQCHFGYLTAQTHCTRAIDYLKDELGYKVDTDRIYMCGLSMGGGAAASYASRHLSGKDGYRVAGLILVASSLDWVHSYYQNDPGVQYWLPLLVGGPPTTHNFKYRQIGTLAIISGDTYRLDRSMGQNFDNNMPVFLTYAGNDPLTYGPYQNGIFADMLNDLGANLLTDYHAYNPDPHKWSLLDMEMAFDFIDDYSLQDQETKDVQVVIDRSDQFYWADVNTVDPETFSGLIGQTQPAQNKVMVTDTSNIDALTVDCEWAGLDDGQPLYLEYDSFSEISQEITLKPIATEPTYLVDDGGVLFSGYTYDPGEDEISISWDGMNGLDLKASFQPYNLTLDAPLYAQLAQQVQVSLSNGDANDPYLILFAVNQKETKLGARYILVDPLPPTLWFFSTLNGLGEMSFNLDIPNDGSLLGTTFFMQFLTFGPPLKEISNMTSTTIQL